MTSFHSWARGQGGGLRRRRPPRDLGRSPAHGGAGHRAHRLAEMRRQLGLTQREVAHRMHVRQERVLPSSAAGMSSAEVVNKSFSCLRRCLLGESWRSSPTSTGRGWLWRSATAGWLTQDTSPLCRATPQSRCPRFGRSNGIRVHRLQHPKGRAPALPSLASHVAATLSFGLFDPPLGILFACVHEVCHGPLIAPILNALNDRPQRVMNERPLGRGRRGEVRTRCGPSQKAC